MFSMSTTANKAAAVSKIITCPPPSTGAPLVALIKNGVRSRRMTREEAIPWLEPVLHFYEV